MGLLDVARLRSQMDPTYLSQLDWLNANFPHDDPASLGGGFRRMYAEQQMADPSSQLAQQAAALGITPTVFQKWVQDTQVQRDQEASRDKATFNTVAAIGGAGVLGASGALGSLGGATAAEEAAALGAATPATGAAAAVPAATGTLGAIPAASTGVEEAAMLGGALPAAAEPVATATGIGTATTAANGALGEADLAALIESGTTGTAGAAMEAGALGAGSIDQYLASLPAATQGVLGQLGLGDAGAALDKLLKLGLPIATIAGIFEKPDNPLLGPIVQAAQKAIGQADQFAALGPIGLTPAQEQAIALAKENVGGYKPYLEKSGALADKAAGGIQQSEIDRYLNPYLDSVLAPGIRDIEQAAARRREQLKAVTSMSGNDLRTPSTDPNRFNVEDNLLDQSTLQSIGDLSAKTRATGYDTATGLAGKDLDRNLSSSNIYGGLGKAEGALGATDVASLTSAGALERMPQEDARTKAADAAKLYTGVAGQTGALNAAAQPSTLTNVTGALGVLKSAKDIGLY